MLYHLLVPLAQYHAVFNLFRYQTFRAAGAVVTAFLVAFYLGPPIIRRLRMLKVGQVVRSEGPQTHLGKRGTPTMGGVLIVLATVIPTLLWAELTNGFIITSLLVLVWLGALGFMDDYLKVVRQKTEGLVGRYKIVGQVSIGLFLGWYLWQHPLSTLPGASTTLPFVAYGGRPQRVGHANSRNCRHLQNSCTRSVLQLHKDLQPDMDCLHSRHCPLHRTSNVPETHGNPQCRSKHQVQLLVIHGHLQILLYFLSNSGDQARRNDIRHTKTRKPGNPLRHTIRLLHRTNNCQVSVAAYRCV